MSLLRVVLNDLLHELNTFPIAREAISLPSSALRTGYLRPWRNLAAGEPAIKSDDKEFSVHLDVSQFKPEEIKVSLDDHGFVKVEGSHEERSDELGYVARYFSRRYKLPEDVIPDTLASNLTPDGVLNLQAAKKPKETEAAREIKITRTGQPALEKKSEEPEKEGA